MLMRSLGLAVVALLLPVCLTADQGPYEYRTASRDGIGKFYAGREISQVMGHLAAGWLERPNRERQERTDLLLANLELQPGDTVVDLGAGTGYFSLPMARMVRAGKVLAVDIQPEMLTIIRDRAKKEGLANIEPVLATPTSPGLPADSVDLVLMVDAYHEFSHPFEVMSEVTRALKPSGRVVLVEYRGEDPMVPIKPLHKMTADQVKREMALVGLGLLEQRDILPQQHFLVFTPNKEYKTAGDE